MRNVLGNISVWLLIALATGSSAVIGSLHTAVEIFAPQHYNVLLDELPSSSAVAWIAFDAITGEVFVEHNAETPMPIASVTKLPAAATLYHQHDLWATTTVSWSDIAAEGRAGKLAAGDEYNLYTLLFPLLLESSNDAAAAMGRTVATLTSEMNEYSDALGLAHTSFADTSGLSDQNISTAEELAVLTRDVYASSRHVFAITGLPSYLSSNTGWLNNNPFITMPEYVGGKHGYTHAAKHTAVAVFEEQLGGDTPRSIGYVILGSDDLVGDVQQLREYVRSHVTVE